ncbi:MAG: peptidylprolyl isomerase [Longimicrobiales bacterium]
MNPVPPPRITRSTAPVLWIVLTTLLASGCGESEPPALTVGPVSYSQDQLLGLSDSRRQSLAELTAFALAVADSSTEALGTPLIAEWTEDRLLEILAAELTLEAADIGDDVLEAQYLTNPEWELTVRHILFFSERWRSADHRAEAEAKAGRAMASLRGGADFSATAAALSEEPGAEGRQGLLTPGREGSWVPEFWAAALALEAGEISPVTETQYGYHILRLEDREIVPFEEARSVIARAVADQLGDPGDVLQGWMDERGGADRETGRPAALEEAERRGLAVPQGEVTELERVWDDLAYRFSATFGFRYGWTTEQIAAGALAALSNPAQNVNLSRSELSTYRSLIDARYPINVPGTPQVMQP